MEWRGKSTAPRPQSPREDGVAHSGGRPARSRRLHSTTEIAEVEELIDSVRMLDSPRNSFGRCAQTCVRSASPYCEAQSLEVSCHGNALSKTREQD